MDGPFHEVTLYRRLLLVAALWSLVPGAMAQGPADVTAEEVKAAFLYQIARYVEWPGSAFPRPDTPLVITVVGAESLADELSRIVSGRMLHGRRVVVQRLKDVSALTGAHLLFIGHEQKARLAEVAPKSRQGILIVTEWESALTAGAMVNFVMVEGRVRFQVALDTVMRSGLTMSSRLLAVAQQVYSGAP
jgi:hypothetical protein